MQIEFADPTDTDPVMVISCTEETQPVWGAYFKAKGFQVWVMSGMDLCDVPVFYLGFPLPERQCKLLGGLIHDLLELTFNKHTSSTTWRREAWNNIQGAHPTNIKVL